MSVSEKFCAIKTTVTPPHKIKIVHSMDGDLVFHVVAAVCSNTSSELALFNLGHQAHSQPCTGGGGVETL